VIPYASLFTFPMTPMLHLLEHGAAAVEVVSGQRDVSSTGQWCWECRRQRVVVVQAHGRHFGHHLRARQRTRNHPVRRRPGPFRPLACCTV